jgi:hypothetical protein
MTGVTVTRSVLHEDLETSGVERNYAVYRQEVDEGEFSRFYLEIDPQLWEELGFPSTITISVEPGDTLNPSTDE